MSSANLIYLLITFLALWLIALTVFLIRLLLHYQKLTAGLSQKDLISALNNFIAKTKKNQEDIEALKSNLLAETKAGRDHLQRVGFKRFNPFTDTGGNQSFILSLLDENGTGVVISSLHSRENTRVYSKKIEKGVCPDQVLSKEEESVIKDSLK